MRFLFSSIITFSLFSCSEPAKNNSVDSVPLPAPEKIDTVLDFGPIPFDTVKTTHLQIGNSGLFIDLPVTHKIEEQPGELGGDFEVYYFTPIDTSIYHGEGGIYFGPKPDEHPPTTDYTKHLVSGNFLGVKTNWVEYKTAAYMQTETFIENAPGQKIHVWFYANNTEEMAKLLKMIKSIKREK